jgi:hypothetical protein
MQRFKAIMVMTGLFFSVSLLHSQSFFVGFQPRQLKFAEPSPVFYISSQYGKKPGLAYMPSYTVSTEPLVLKSPVHYTAFFCKMEVKTANALGIMIKVHAGDYDVYTGGNNAPR